MVLQQVEPKKIYIRVDEVPPELCFTANSANSTVQLTKIGSPTSVNLETSTDWSTWSDYTIWNTITLVNIGDKVYMRNKSETPTGLWLDENENHYQFVMSWSIAASWDVNYLLCKNSTDTLSNYCYRQLFSQCTSLTSAPKLPATTLANNCYDRMFVWCTNLTTLPEIKALNLPLYCCWFMFSRCTSIKLSTTQTWEYQTEYRIPITWTGTEWTDSLLNMFNSTWWTFTWTPSINITYYTSNTLV